MRYGITTLSENTAGLVDLLAEWGLSVLIEADGQNILLDSGKSISVGPECRSAWESIFKR